MNFEFCIYTILRLWFSLSPIDRIYSNRMPLIATKLLTAPLFTRGPHSRRAADSSACLICQSFYAH